MSIKKVGIGIKIRIADLLFFKSGFFSSQVHAGSIVHLALLL